MSWTKASMHIGEPMRDSDEKLKDEAPDAWANYKAAKRKYLAEVYARYLAKNIDAISDEACAGLASALARRGVE